MIVPAGVRMAKPRASTIECVTRMASTRNGPISTTSRGWIVAQLELLDAELVELVAHEPERQRHAVDRHRHALDEERHRADVVLVAVRQEDAP